MIKQRDKFLGRGELLMVEVEVLDGNEAVAMGAIVAGCLRFLYQSGLEPGGRKLVFPVLSHCGHSPKTP